METPKEYYYTYYSYEEWGRGYFGSRGCKCLPEEDVKYFGSFSDKNFNPTQKIILKDDYTTREEAIADEIILHDYYDVANNPHFANKAKATSTKFCISGEDAIKNGKKNGKRNYELSKGVHARTKEQMREDGIKGGSKTKELGKGVHARTKDQMTVDGKKGAQKAKELSLGIYSFTPEQIKENASKGGSISGKKQYELGIGVHSLTREQMRENGIKGGRKVSSQKWKCLETGHISNAAALARYQIARGIDTTMRERIE